ncbi:MAG: SufE family protein [Hyphomicrobiales bacterium]|nr:SufE family protein [Hyphomicrobiales bacterium]
MPSPALQDIVENFELLDDWDDRYRYLIELGRTLEPLPEAARTEANRVRGCASQVWLQASVGHDADGAETMVLRGDSDAHIVRGLVAFVLAAYSGQKRADFAGIDVMGLFTRLGLGQHLSPQRNNGVRAMVDRIKAMAA